MAIDTRNGVCPFALTTRVLEEVVWNAGVIERRQNELLGVLELH